MPEIKFNPRRVHELRPGDTIKRRAFGLKVVKLVQAIRFGEHAATLLRYEDGAASVYNPARLVLVKAATRPPRRADPYSEHKFTSRSGHTSVEL